MPTEAEWEYACRGGTATAWYTGDDEGSLGNAAWYDVNSEGKTHEVGKKAPNGFGLFDMHGNVHEYCWDWFGPYPSDAQTNPTGASSGPYRVWRSGSWYGAARFTRSAYRGNYVLLPHIRDDNLGFRVVCAP
jgi:formylglycine-generating enzyme required for sulfatase activity